MTTSHRAASTLIVFAALSLWPALAPALAAQDTGYEEFEEVDPYTRGEPALMEALGYESYGPFPWLKGHSTEEVALHMGAMPILWVETAHFRLGSTLATYELGGDKEEKERLKDELARLKEKLGKKFKPPKRELDPWLRLHLYAQRLEELYTAFHEDFGLAPADYDELGPVLGHPSKILVLLCERQSEYTRHAKEYLDVVNDTSFRFGWSGMPAGFATNIENIESRFYGELDLPMDAVLACSLASGLGQVFLDQYRQADYGTPEWLRRGYSHVLWRRFDDRQVTDAGYEEGRSVGDDDHEWARRVRNLVENDFYATLADMFAWEPGQLNGRDHMVAWSKVEFLLAELEGDRSAFLRALCVKKPKGNEAQAREKRVADQNRALKEHFDLLPDEFDERWSAWVLKTYPKK